MAAVAFATEPWINEVDTGLTDYLFSTNYTEGNLPLLKDMRAVMDFDYAAHQFLDIQKYSFYRTAAGGEWSELEQERFTGCVTLICSLQATGIIWTCGRRSCFVPVICMMSPS